MDYITKPTSRATLREFNKIVRAIFGCESDDEPFPVLRALEKLPDFIDNTIREKWCTDMGGRGTYAAGNNVPYTYETVGYVDDAKVLFGKPGTGLHNLPAEAHSSNVYIKLHKDGTLNMMRIYDNDHYLTTEIAYHPEPDLTGNRKPVLHIQYYDRNFKRTNANFLNYETFKKYKKYLVGRKWYND